MITNILLYKSKKIEVYCTPIVHREMFNKFQTYIKLLVSAEKTLISNISRKYPDSKGLKYNFIFKKGRTEDTLGSCDVEYDGDILIELNARQSIRTLYTTIAHELVHARQFISGKLAYDTKIKYFTYEGVKHRYIYHKQPWEIEAYKLQEQGANIMKRWLSQHADYSPKLKITEV